MLQTGSGRIQCHEGSLEFELHKPLRSDSVVPPATLLLLHEGLGSVSMWRNFPSRLAAATGCNVLAYSRLGYGESDPCKIPREVNYMHLEGQEVLPQVISQIDSTEIVLIGHSDGASIAAIYAGDNPDIRIKSIVLMAPHFFTENLALKSIEAAKEAYELGDLRKRLERYHGANTDNAFYGWNGAWLNPAFKSWDITEFLPQISVPILLLQGKQDQYGSNAQLEVVKQRCDVKVETCILEDCRHSPHLEQEQRTIGAISSFLHNVSL
jgi:pimeloyl-ACP methyl ester carboxylesterase